MKLVLLTVIFSAMLIAGISAKSATDSETVSSFNKNPWRNMMKFAIAPGTGEFQAKFQFTKSITRGETTGVNMNLLVFLDEDWDHVRTLDTCQKKVEAARFNSPVNIRTDGSWTTPIVNTLSQELRTHVWFFVIADCQNNLANYLAYSPATGSRLKWDVTVRNSDGSHFSAEENGTILPLVLFIILIGALFISDTAKFFKFYRVEEAVDYPTLAVTVGLFVEFLSLVCEVLHLWIYSHDGQGSFILNFANQTLSVTSQFLITCLLLLMASGWSINFMKFKDMDVIMPIGGVIGFVMLVIVGIGRMVDEEQYTYHDYENWAGVLFMGMRIALFAMWAYLFQGTYKRTNSESQRIFFNQFGLLSTVYFLAVPAVVMFATAVVAPYWRHKVVLTGTVLMQTLVLVVLTLLFTTKSNRYYQISMRAKSMLPSNKME